ncbi:hypothetical protein EDC14_100848 [Hydrogenispora ethanolica]|jgi:hypothetical protein|uniref:Uncharacterized protein n=1 Tax=Hydrogenispora ethanolica TaxID=1082276 RepID=A0A4R1RW47_HYDET|nr:hypothetical protein EDC14_100848 [Hydrogenispora ethanolica]
MAFRRNRIENYLKYTTFHPELRKMVKKFRYLFGISYFF